MTATEIINKANRATLRLYWQRVKKGCTNMYLLWNRNDGSLRATYKAHFDNSEAYLFRCLHRVNSLPVTGRSRLTLELLTKQVADKFNTVESYSTVTFDDYIKVI